MLTVYLASLAFGGVMLAASFLGGDGHDVGDGDVGADGPDHDVGPSHAHDGTDQHAGYAGLVPFLSLRFWVFALTFFGLAGTVLGGLGLLGATATAVVAGGVGVGTGYGASRIFQALAQKPVGLLPEAETHVGSEGKLLLPVGKGQRGKLRLDMRGAQVDMIAETESDEALPAGTTVLVVGVRGHVALVERSPAAAALEPVANPETTKEPA